MFMASENIGPTVAQQLVHDFIVVDTARGWWRNNVEVAMRRCLASIHQLINSALIAINYCRQENETSMCRSIDFAALNSLGDSIQIGKSFSFRQGRGKTHLFGMEYGVRRRNVQLNWICTCTTLRRMRACARVIPSSNPQHILAFFLSTLAEN